MGIPLIVTEEEIADLAKKYYPHLNVFLWNYLEAPQKIVQSAEIVFCCLPRDLFDEIFFFAQKLLAKRVHTIWCPHGNSDKGHSSFFMEALKKEQVALIYGKKMIDFLMKKHVFDQLKAYVLIDNFRYGFFKLHQMFYRQIVQKEISGHLLPGKKNILYAPTWQDYENSSSFFEATDILIKNLPAEYNLIVKIHPNIFLTQEARIEVLKEKTHEQKGILILTQFPPIYPLLHDIDIYVGDMSSIGYDFLTFDKPMFFLNQNRRDSKIDPGLYLFRCGVEVLPEQYSEIYQIIAKHIPYDKRDFSEARKEVYRYTFGVEKSLERLREEILKAYAAFSEDDLNFL